MPVRDRVMTCYLTCHSCKDTSKVIQKNVNKVNSFSCWKWARLATRATYWIRPVGVPVSWTLWGCGWWLGELPIWTGLLDWMQPSDEQTPAHCSGEVIRLQDACTPCFSDGNPEEQEESRLSWCVPFLLVTVAQGSSTCTTRIFATFNFTVQQQSSWGREQR